MKNHIIVEINVGALKNMTPEQFTSLKANILADGYWEMCDKLTISGGGDYIGVQPVKDGKSMIFIGIEQDGYTHS